MSNERDDDPNAGPDISGLTYLALVGKLVGEAAEFVLHAAEIARLKLEELNAQQQQQQQPTVPVAPTLTTTSTSSITVTPGKRGLVLPLTREQRLQRMRYLAGLCDIFALDEFVRRDGAPLTCPDIYYLLQDHNGGKDPTAPDPADRWSKPGSTFVNRTCDCIGAMAWAGGWDRYQPVRFAHLYKGWINTDSMCMEIDRVARGEQPNIPACFRRLDYPVEGCYVVCRSNTPGHTRGHIGGCIEVPKGLDLSKRDAWEAIKVVDVANRTPKKANGLTTARGWFGTGAYFVEPCMLAA